MWPFKKKEEVAKEDLVEQGPEKANVFIYTLKYDDGKEETMEGTESYWTHPFFEIYDRRSPNDGNIFMMQSCYLKSVKSKFKETVDLPTSVS